MSWVEAKLWIFFKHCIATDVTAARLESVQDMNDWARKSERAGREGSRIFF